MSEQPEIDRASDIMRSRFLSGCQRISTDLAWLDEHAEEIRADVRAYLFDAAKKIEVAQGRLAAQLDRLPAAQWERFKAMLTLLRAQQDVLDSADTLMQRARVNAVPRKIPGPAEGPEVRDAASTIGGPVREKQQFAAQITRSVIWGAASVRLIVVTLIAAGLVFAYLTISHGSKRQAIATKPIAPASGAVGGRVAERLRVATDSAAAVPNTTAAQAAIVTESNSATPTAPPPVTARGSAGFVPVVFTDMDKVKVLRAFTELQLRFPKLFSQRRAEAQPVDLGAKGLWHRLVVLPPGSRQSATEFCDQLLAAGYDRCWVKDY